MYFSSQENWLISTTDYLYCDIYEINITVDSRLQQIMGEIENEFVLFFDRNEIKLFIEAFGKAWGVENQYISNYQPVSMCERLVWWNVWQ